MSGPREDADAIAEAAALIFHLDGCDVRSVWLFCRLAGIQVRPLPKGTVHGYFDAKRKTIYLDVSGEESEIAGRMAHEVGHVILVLLGYRMPHEEELASRVGRAWVISREAMRLALRNLTRGEVIAHYSPLLPGTDVVARMHEVQSQTMRNVG